MDAWLVCPPSAALSPFATAKMKGSDLFYLICPFTNRSGIMSSKVNLEGRINRYIVSACYDYRVNARNDCGEEDHKPAR